MHKPFADLRVLDFTRMYAGPFCTMLIGELGADVVKVKPAGGDPTRIQGPPFHEGLRMSFLASNRNKRSIVLDLERVFTHPKTHARRMLASARQKDGTRLSLIRPAVKFGSFDDSADWRAPPGLGVDSDEVLRDWIDGGRA